MDFLRDKIKSMYLKYSSAAFGSAVITSICSNENIGRTAVRITYLLLA